HRRDPNRSTRRRGRGCVGRYCRKWKHDERHDHGRHQGPPHVRSRRNANSADTEPSAIPAAVTATTTLATVNEVTPGSSCTNRGGAPKNQPAPPPPTAAAAIRPARPPVSAPSTPSRVLINQREAPTSCIVSSSSRLARTAVRMELELMA